MAWHEMGFVGLGYDFLMKNYDANKNEDGTGPHSGISAWEVFPFLCRNYVATYGVRDVFEDQEMKSYRWLLSSDKTNSSIHPSKSHINRQSAAPRVPSQVS